MPAVTTEEAEVEDVHMRSRPDTATMYIRRSRKDTSDSKHSTLCAQ